MGEYKGDIGWIWGYMGDYWAVMGEYRQIWGNMDIIWGNIRAICGKWGGVGGTKDYGDIQWGLWGVIGAH